MDLDDEELEETRRLLNVDRKKMFTLWIWSSKIL